MGLANNAFETFVLSVIRKHCPTISETALTYRASKNGKFMSITATIEATSQKQLDAIYGEFTSNPIVLMAL